MMKNRPLVRPSLSTARIAEIFHLALNYRRISYQDDDFFRMADLYEDLSGEGSAIQIRTFRGREGIETQRKAFVIEKFDLIRIRVEAAFMTYAKKGDLFANYKLAHEFAHRMLEHSAEVSNFQTSLGERGFEDRPLTVEELEADYTAVFFQCGVALFDTELSALKLAKLACTDVKTVGLLQEMVQHPVFLREFHKPKKAIERVIL